jgi:DNA helicase-2/ATP-dependent DNA helicase PcrA
MEFPKRYPECKIFKLETNYRSSPEILTLANSSIAKNLKQFEKVLRPVKKTGPAPQVISLEDVNIQAEFVVQKILELNQDGMPFREMAVLYRAHYHSMEVQLELTRRGIPFEMRSGLKFFEQAHIKDATSYLRIVANPMDEMAWKRIFVLYPKIGRGTAHKLWEVLSTGSDPLRAIESEKVYQVIKKGTAEGWKRLCATLKRLDAQDVRTKPSEMIQIILDDGYEAYLQDTYPDHQSRIEDLKQMSSFAVKFESTADFLGQLALLTNVASEDVSRDEHAERDCVVLSTIHQAKGLEWKAVFVVWLIEGRFPDARCLGTAEEEEEERRLFYVAVTRAKEELYLTYPILAPTRGFDAFQRPSRFIGELDRKSYEEIKMPGTDGFGFEEE